ncbi:Uncharacterised protein [Vibrio cholerae]|nr:Uncharacterised protein [Vibrio cholerae]
MAVKLPLLIGRLDAHLISILLPLRQRSVCDFR